MIAVKNYAALALSIATLAVSPQVFAAAAAEPAAAKDEKVSSDEKIICRKVEVVGSRLRSERVCLTASEWAAKKQQDRQALEQTQSRNQYRSN